MITKKQKQEIVADLIEKLQKVNGIYLVDFIGMSVEDAIRFRRAMKELGVDYKVAKNTLIIRAMKEVGGFENIPEDKLTGPTGIIFGYDDPVKPAKVIKEQFDKHNLPALKAALLEGQFFDGSQLKELAALPSKDDMMASIVGSLHAPISGIVGAINAVMRDVAYLVEEVAKKQAS